MAKKTGRITYRRCHSQNPEYPPAYFKCKNHSHSCAEVFPSLELKNKHEKSCLAEFLNKAKCGYAKYLDTLDINSLKIEASRWD